MSLVRNYLLNNSSLKTASICSYLFSDKRLNRAQYYTCLNAPAKTLTNLLTPKILVEQNRKSSVFQYIKDKNYDITSKAKNTILKLIPTRRLKYRKLGYLWYKTLDEIDVNDFFEVFSMLDTFYSRFKVIELHVWMLLYHLPNTGTYHEIVRLGLIEAMWQDNEKRAKLVSALNKNFKQNFKDLYGKFLLTQLLYDDGFLKGDSSLCSAVWCCFFNKEDVDPRLLEVLISYIRYQMQHLNKYNMEELTEKEEKGQVWAPVRPHMEEVLRRI